MQQLAIYRTQIEEGLQELALDNQPRELYEPIRYTLELGGKRMRPILVLLACDMVGGDGRHAIAPALGVELFHNFTLLHDDIMDEAPLRRGQPTVYKKYNPNIAILSGDVMYTIACQQVAEAPASVLKPVLDVFHDTAIKVCEGQQWDLNFETDEQVAIEAYLEMIKLKTAVLLGGSLQMGALIGGASANLAKDMYAIGVHLGLAFQLQDDILDTYGDPEKFGKQVGGDIIQNKKTYLLLQAQQQANVDQSATLTHWLTVESFQPEAKVEAVKRIFDALNIREQAEAERDRHYDIAIKTLEALTLPAEAKAPLQQLAAQLLNRDH